MKPSEYCLGVVAEMQHWSVICEIQNDVITQKLLDHGANSYMRVAAFLSIFGL